MPIESASCLRKDHLINNSDRGPRTAGPRTAGDSGNVVQVQSMLCSQRSEQVQLSHHWRCHWARPRAQSGPRLLVSKTGWSPFLAGPSPIVRANPGAEGSAGTAPGPRGSTVGSSRGPSHVPDRCPAFLWLQASPEGGAGDLRSQERPSSGMLVGVVLQKGEILGCSPYPHRGSQGTEPHCLPQTTPHPRVSNYLLSPLPAVRRGGRSRWRRPSCGPQQTGSSGWRPGCAHRSPAPGRGA